MNHMRLINLPPIQYHSTISLNNLAHLLRFFNSEHRQMKPRRQSTLDPFSTETSLPLSIFSLSVHFTSFLGFFLSTAGFPEAIRHQSVFYCHGTGEVFGIAIGHSGVSLSSGIYGFRDLGG